MKTIAAILLATIILLTPLDGFAQQLKPPPELSPEPNGPRLDTYIVKIVQNKEARLAAFEAGEIDEVALEPDDIERIQKNRPDAFFELIQGYVIVPLQFNLRRYPISEKPFRQALAHAIDRDFVINQILKGFAVPVYSVVLPIYGAFANPNAKTYEFDTKKAEQTLDQAGWVRGQDGLRVDPKTGKPFRTIEIITQNEQTSPSAFRVGRYIGQQMQKLGFKVTHTPVTTTIYTQRIPNQDFDMYFNGWSLAIYPTFMGRFWDSQFDVRAGTNRYGVRDPQVDKLARDFLNAPTQEKAIQILNQLEALIQELIPWIPVYSPVDIIAISGKVAGTVHTRLKGLTFPVDRSFFHYLTVRLNDLPLGGLYDDVSSAEFANLNPMWYLFVNEGFILGRVFEPFTALKPDDPYGPREMRLADSIGQEFFKDGNVDKTRITIKLAKNAFWHDGTPVSSEDVRWTMEVAGKQWKTRRQWTDFAETIGIVEKIEAPDSKTVILTLSSSAWVHLINIMGYRILPKHIWSTLSKEEAQAVEPSLKQHPRFPFLTLLIGSGPWILKEHVPGTSVALIWNPAYYRTNPEKTLDLRVNVVHVYDDEEPIIQVDVKDYQKKEATNARVIVKVFNSAGALVKEVEAAHTKSGKYLAGLGRLPADTYKVQVLASVPVVLTTAIGAATALAKTSEATLNVTPYYNRYLPYVGLSAIVLVAAAVWLALRARRKAKADLFASPPAP